MLHYYVSSGDIHIEKIHWCVYMDFGIHQVECGRIQYSMSELDERCIPKSIYTQGGYFL